MIKNYLSLCFVLAFTFVSSFSIAQEKNNTELTNPIIRDITLTKNTTYIVPKELLVSNNAILTIEEGVVLQNQNNDKITIIIDTGSKVIASGSHENPITAATKPDSIEKPSIVMKSAGSTKDMAVVGNDFNYESIKNPTILMNPASAPNTEISSVQSDF